MGRNLIYIFALFFALMGCKSPDARRPVQNTSGTFIKESTERNKLIYDKEEAVIEKMIAEDSLNQYTASESGFWYYYNIKDTTTTQMPMLGDIVQFTFDIKNLNGTPILSEKETGLQTYKIDQSNQELASGIREGLKLMKVGETVTFLLPSYKAFGYYGIEEKLGTNVPVQSTVTLKSIEKTTEK